MPTRALRLLLPVALLAGCSALQIDVDVYKGPLANEEETQVRQFAALAIAAKPLLASLRNDIENEWRGVKGLPELERQLGDRDKLATYIGHSDATLHSRLARFVNGTLQAYEDLDHGPAGDLRRELGRVKAARRGMQVDAADRQLAEAITVPSEPGARQAFASAYRAFLCPPAHAACGGPGGEPVARPRPPPLHGKPCQALRDAAPAAQMPAIACASADTSDAIYQLMSDEGRVAVHAQWLLGGPNDAFVKRVIEIASHYREGRAAMHAAFRAALALLEAGADVRVSRADRAELVALTVQPTLLACVLTSTHPEAAYPALPLRAPLGNALAAAIPPTRTPGTPNPGREVVRRWAADDPAATADLLRIIDQRVGSLHEDALAQCPDVKAATLPRLRPAAARTHGLSRGIGSDDDVDDLIERLDAATPLLGSGNAAGFDRARPLDGIETLTREFLDAMDANAHRLDRDASRLAVAQLEETLLFFAERVLFVINNITHSTLTDELPDVQGQRLNRLATRMAMLQTLGNTLVLHANDLRRRQIHREAQRDAGRAELRAAQRVWEPGADAAFDAFVVYARGQVRAGEAAVAREASAASSASARAQALQIEVTAAKKKADAAKARADAAENDAKPLQDTLRTLFLPRDIRDVAPAPADVVLAGQEAGDAARIAEKIAQEAGVAGNRTTPAGLAAALLGWVQGLALEPALGATRAERLQAALTFIAEKKDAFNLVTPRSEGSADTFAALRTLLLGWARSHRDGIAALKKAQADAERSAATLDQQLKAEQAREQQAGNQGGQAAEQVSTSKLVVAQLEQAREAVVARAVKSQLRDMPGLQRLIVAQRAATPAAADRHAAAAPGDTARKTRKDDIATALAALRKLTPPRSVGLADLEAAAPGAPLQPRQVFDQVIASLRQQRIQATAAGDQTRADDLLRAINLAFDARGDSTFLRPTSDYLRSVYASTAVAGDVQSQYPNLLNDYLRGVKNWVSESFLDELQFKRESSEAKEQVEKLYWQNINRVTLSGGGDVNYVLAKDDVGNWYVKAYAADPGTVIRSAQSLALFGAGRRIDTNLLRRTELERRVDQGSDDADRERAATELKAMGPNVSAGLERVRERYAARYVVALDALVLDLEAGIAALPDDLGTAAQAAPALAGLDAARFNTAVNGAKVTHLDPALARLLAARTLPAQDAARRARLEDASVEALAALRRFARQAGATLLADKSLGPADGPRPAADLVRGESLRRMTSAATRLKAALAEFEGGLLVIGEAGAPATPK